MIRAAPCHGRACQQVFADRPAACFASGVGTLFEASQGAFGVLELGLGTIQDFQIAWVCGVHAEDANRGSPVPGEA